MTDLNKLVINLEALIAKVSPVCETLLVPIVYMVKTEEVLKSNGIRVTSAVRDGESFVFSVEK